MKHKDVYYYTDLVNDDFASAQIKSRPLPDDFKYFHHNIFYKILADFIYFAFAKPGIFIYRKLVWHHKFVNHKALKIAKKGAFYYGNHTQSTADACIPNGFRYAQRNFIVVNNDAFAIPFLKTIVGMLGAIPLSEKLSHKKELFRFIEDASTRQNKSITIYPEAHIWPYYTKIRPFSAGSFKYPARFNKPVFTFTNCYQKRKWSKKANIVTFIDGPFWPDMELDINDRAQKLRDEVYEAMTKRAEKYSTYQVVKYIKVDKKEE